MTKAEKFALNTPPTFMSGSGGRPYAEVDAEGNLSVNLITLPAREVDSFVDWLIETFLDDEAPTVVPIRSCH